MSQIEAKILREVKVMTRKEIIMKAINKKLTWIQAADILGITARHMRRLKQRYEQFGFGGLRDYRGGKQRRKRIPLKVIEEVCRLKKEVYPDFSVRHFYEQIEEKHKLEISYNWTRVVLEEAGIVEKAESRGKHRRRRERRPMRGMLLHIDGSTHEWISGVPKQDLIVTLDDADGKILYASFFPQEGTYSTFMALNHVLTRWGRFCEIYHDCGSHFGKTSLAGKGPDEEQNGQVSRALGVLGIKQIFARSPQARGRSERAFGTIQGRLPQELRLAGIRDYDSANAYLQKTFVPKFNRKFTVKPAQDESAFVPLVGIDLKLLLSIQSRRIVGNDNTVTYKNLILQIPQTEQRPHYVRCPVTVHEFLNNSLGISYQGKLLGEYNLQGQLIRRKRKVA